MSSTSEMLSSVASKLMLWLGVSVEYPVDDGSICAVSTGVFPASGGTIPAVSGEEVFPD